MEELLDIAVDRECVKHMPLDEWQSLVSAVGKTSGTMVVHDLESLLSTERGAFSRCYLGNN